MLCHACGRECADTAPFCPYCGANPQEGQDGPPERTIALDPSELGLVDPSDEEEKTAAFDPSELGLHEEPTATNDADAEDDEEEKTAVFDPSEIGLLEEPASAARVDPRAPTLDAQTAAFDPSAMGFATDTPPPDIDDRAVESDASPAPQQEERTAAFHPSSLSQDDEDGEERTVAMEIPAGFFDESEVDMPLTPAEPAPAEPAPAEPAPAEPAPAEPQAPLPPPPASPSAPPPPPPLGGSLGPLTRQPPGPPGGRPSPPPPPPPSGGISTAMPAIIAGGVTLLVILLGLVVWLYVFDDADKTTCRTAPLSSETESNTGDDDRTEDEASVAKLDMVIPASSNVIAEVNLKRLWNSWPFEVLESVVNDQLNGDTEYALFKDRTGLELQDLKRLKLGAAMDGSNVDAIALVQFKKLDPKNFEAWLSEKADGNTVALDGTSFFQRGPEEPLAGVVGPRQAALGTKKMLSASKGGQSWETKKTLASAMELLRSSATIRVISALDTELKALIPVEAIPGGKSLGVGDVFGLSWAADDDLIVEFIYMPVGKSADSRLDALHTEVQELLQGAKAERSSLSKELEGELPPAAITAGLATLDNLKLKKRGGALYLKTRVPRADMEPLIAMAKQMAPPAPPKAVAPPKSKTTPTSEADSGGKAPSEVSASLPESCKRLVTCCDALVQTTPAVKPSCDAQRSAFEQVAKTPASARAALTQGLASSCKATLTGFAQLPDAPDVCSGN